MAEYTTTNTDLGNSIVVGWMGILAAFFMVVIGWLPGWILFGVIVVGALLQDSKYFATGIIGTASTGAFVFIGWAPSWVFFSIIILATLLLAVRLAGMYVNTGQNK